MTITSCIFPLMVPLTSPADALTPQVGDLTTTKDGWSTMDIVWNGPNPKPVTMNLSINKAWNIESATLGLTGAAYITDPGTSNAVVSYPVRPRMDIGNNGEDWVWTGTFGHQDRFANSSVAEQQSYAPMDKQYLDISLPVGAKIQDVKLDVNNTLPSQFEYTMTVGKSTVPVWYKSSIGFTKGPFIPTNDVQGNPAAINSICIDHLDITSPYKGIVAAGARGTFYVLRNDKSSPTGFTQAMQLIGQLDPKTNTIPDLLDCSLSDFNQDVNNEVALTTANGRIYVLTQDGMGHFQYPTKYMINSTNVTSRMDSVTFGDVNGDAWGDVIGGYVNGQFYVATYNNTVDKFNAPYVVKAASGALNGVQVLDTDSNGVDDLVGASADRNWWTVKNTGSNKPATQWETAKPVHSGGSDLTSLAVKDLNWDQSPDIISGNLDGSIYVVYNVGGAYNSSQVHIVKGGLGSMRAVATGDLDLDGAVDIVGLNADGWLYGVKNNFGNLEDGKKMVQVGTDQTSMALGDLNNDNSPDIAVGGSKGITIYYNDNGPFAQTIGTNDSGILKSEVQKYLDNFNTTPDDYDAYGNLVVDVPLKISSTYAGGLKFDKVNVTYTFEAKPDIKIPLALYVKANRGSANTNGFITVPIVFSSDQAGKLHISDINIHYKETLQSIINFPAPKAEFNISTSIIVSGHSNFDPDCTLQEYTYKWFVDGRLLGTGCSMNISTRTELGGVGNHNLRLYVANSMTGEVDTNTIPIILVLPKEPNKIVKIDPNPIAKHVVGQNIHLKAIAPDLTPQDRVNLTYKILFGPTGMLMDNRTGDIFWKPTINEVGVNTLVIQGILMGNVTNSTFLLKVDKAVNPVAMPACFNWPVVVTVIIVCVAFGMVIAGTEVGIFAMYSLIFLLYTRLKSEMVLDNFIRGQIYGHICENPGLHLSELKKRLELSNGTLVYHLKTLEREGLVRSYPNGGQRVFFSSKEKVKKEVVRLTRAQRLVLEVIKERPGISQKEISIETELSDSTVNRIVHELKEQGMVRMTKGKSTSWFIVENSCVFLFPVNT